MLQRPLAACATQLSAQSVRQREVTIQELGSIGEFVAAIATIATLVYLAISVRHNTRALHSTMFQQISSEMSRASETVATHPDLSALITKGAAGLASLTPEEHLRLHSFYLMMFRKVESVFMQGRLGSLDSELIEGFERSGISILRSVGGAEWWERAKPAFTAAFATYVDERLNSESLPSIHPSMRAPK